MNNLIIIFVLVIILAILLMKNGSFFDSGGSGADGRSVVDKGNLIVYGSKTCPWCVKQEDYLTKIGMPFTFIDCTKNQCPNFVDGFPTLLLNNKVMNGYTELGPELSYPAPAKTQLPF
jgi:glutaredoxin